MTHATFDSIFTDTLPFHNITSKNRILIEKFEEKKKNRNNANNFVNMHTVIRFIFNYLNYVVKCE